MSRYFESVPEMQDTNPPILTLRLVLVTVPL